jgi:excisionase family DNA binding protein
MSTLAEIQDGGGLERLYTAAELAPLLGVKPSWIEKKARAGEFPVTHLGRYPRFRLSAVAAYLDSK